MQKYYPQVGRKLISFVLVFLFVFQNLSVVLAEEESLKVELEETD